MRRKVIALTLLGVAGGALVACSSDTGDPSGPRPMTGPSSGTPVAIVSGFLDATGHAADTLRVVGENPSSTGLTHLRFEQRIGGLRVVDAYAKATVDELGQIVHVIDRLAPTGSRVVTAAGDPGQAIAAAIDHLGLTGVELASAPVVERVAYVDAAGTLRAGTLVETWTAATNRLYETLVDAAGRVVRVELRTNTDRYNVFVEDPLKGPQIIVDGPGAGNAESPAGWLFAGAHRSIEIAGNNAHAYLDAVSNNRPDRGGSTVGNGQFLTTVDLTTEPSTPGNNAVGVQNLFYLNNIVHDALYRAGFNEAAGNFQVSNFGKGGAGDDPVQAEAQDGGGTDNANFSTPRDGRPPRMQMYLWHGAGPDHEVVVDSPAAVAGTYGASGAEFGPALTTTGVTGDVLLVNDGTGTTTDACEAIATSLAGRIALVDRGTCTFVTKVLNAQNAGAIAVIVANNQGGTATFTMGGTENRIRIPAVMISQNDGATLRSVTGVHATARKDPTPPLMVDGDLDSDVVYHEYGHGLTWRMIGGMSGPLAGAIGEGASDSVSLLLNGDDVVGEYAFSNPLGIRRFPYADYPLTYGDVTGGEVHADGEVFAAIMWRLHELYAHARLGDTVLLEDFVDGMNYTPSTPAWEDMRDGMLASLAQRGLDRDCLIWSAFAQFGVGVGASGVATSAGVTIVESFELPRGCH